METLSPSKPVDPRRYFESVASLPAKRTEREPVCLYLEVTNRCNLLCTTCPRTYVELEPPADMSWELFTSIVDQMPNVQRAVLHGVGEPMLVKNLPQMVRYLKDRGIYTLFNTNGTLLTERNGRAMIDAGLDEMRVSLDASNPTSYLAVRGKNYFARILHNVKRFREIQEREGHALPKVSAWLTGLKETIGELPEFVRVAADIGVKEVYLQRLVFFEDESIGLARPDQALYEQMNAEEGVHIAEAERLAASLGMTFSASGAASEPGMSLKRQEDGSPWSLCRRPWSVMYFTANGRALPCCIAPFSQRGYENYTLGDATKESLRDIWNGVAYTDFREALLSDAPPKACASCGLRYPDAQRGRSARRCSRRHPARRRLDDHDRRRRRHGRHGRGRRARGRHRDRCGRRLRPGVPEGRHVRAGRCDRGVHGWRRRGRSRCHRHPRGASRRRHA